MKMFLKVVALFACLSTVEGQDRTITKVVKLLQDMLEKSQREGDEERVVYAKFKCYCDTSEAEKKASIKQLTETIEILESQIAEIEGSTGGLSSECAKLKVDMAANQQARDEATTVRGKEKKAFLAEEADLDEAIKDSSGAIDTLAKVGADQTDSKGAADNKYFMGKGSALLQAKVKTALEAVSNFMSVAQRGTSTAFLQAPFTGTYTSQSAEVMGILKNMRDTFEKNLEEARRVEAASEKAYNEFMELKEKAFKEMEASYEEKQKSLGGNDGLLATYKKQLIISEKQKADDEEFLDKLLPMCAEKAKGYANRKLLRANEEVAIAEAISILNSDAAFATFGTVDATSKGKMPPAFIQLRSVHMHVLGDDQTRILAQNLLQKAAKDVKSSKLSKVLALLQASNPFDTVLKEIEKMLELINEESASDKENLLWCNKERKENEASLKEKKEEIVSLEEKIDKLTTSIEDPETGLKAQIQATEESLRENKEAQTTETADRLQENMAYQKDIKNLVDAESILERAIKALKAYYDDLEAKLEAGTAFVQEDPTPPEAWKNTAGVADGAYAGQSKEGNNVIDMLEFILTETKNEEADAHQEEETAQADYEDSMTKLKKEESDSEKRLASLQETLAETEEKLLAAQEDLKATTVDKEAIEEYLLKIKPGCDFITENYKLRATNRNIEKAALEKAVKLIKGTPAYMSSVNEATVESYGKCKEPCVADVEDVKCKACMADVTIPGYCAGHPDTTGC